MLLRFTVPEMSRVADDLLVRRCRAGRLGERGMEYVRVGSSGLKVSRICLGMMSYGNRVWHLELRRLHHGDRR